MKVFLNTPTISKKQAYWIVGISNFIHFNPSNLKPCWHIFTMFFFNKNVTYAYFSFKNTQNISIRSQLLTRWTTFLGHLPKRLYFDAEIITDEIQNWYIVKIMMHYCMLTWKVGILIFTDPMIDQFVTGYHLTPIAAAVKTCIMTSQSVMIPWQLWFLLKHEMRNLR